MKGQYFSFDAIVGASIFILTLVAILSYWYGVSNSIEQQQTVYAREATRIADILYSPSEIPYGITVNWTDKHINCSKVDTLCTGGTDAAEVLSSEYGVAIHFSTSSGSNDGWWHSSSSDPKVKATGGDYALSNEIYKIRRVGSYLSDDGTTEMGYVDIYVYNIYQDETEMSFS